MPNPEVPSFVGRSYRFEVDNGAVFRNTYSPDGKTLHWEAVAGPSSGQSETVELFVAEIATNVYFVSWLEASGITVSHAMNLNERTVHAFWTYETGGRRVGELHSGSLHPL